ncbi:AraC family transcriptional regulator [Marinilongibacter aquaticus]|uniref:AraC family transcriptional regulator n=1 Tax=Marinilongibacter aquaticus TaxID=2975157 RepID=UPI0021BDD80D|nr:AraC family transcriptional regulator [Marinilongibacter aquaticus]UBM57427.1 AraC family transcriptional regulator [Marinilongibacter aquaticus]
MHLRKDDLNPHLRQRKLEDMVENRTSYTIEFAELNIYETHQKAEKVELAFPDPVLASMIRGKKIMHLKNEAPFTFLPGESVIVSGYEKMVIDFPEADIDNPTQCLALALSSEKILKIIAELNEKTPLIDDKKGWQLDNENFYFTNDQVVNYLLSHLIEIFTENNKAKDVFAEYTLKELIIRLMQTKARHFLLNNLQQQSTSNRLAFALQYIEEHLDERITVSKLADKACMSEASFFRAFKNQLGLSPIEFIQQKRIALAQGLLTDIQLTIADISACCGFNSLNHFFNVFKKYTKTTPAQYRKSFFEKNLKGKIPLHFLTDTSHF